MLVGHVGPALMARSATDRSKLGTLICAAMLLDVVLWMLVIAGIERVTVPSNYPHLHYLQFDFPFSHSLVGSIAWSLLAASVVGTLRRDVRIGCLIGGLVVSHWLLDAIVHVPELTLWGPGSRRVGLGLWNNQPSAFLIEAGIAAVGLVCFLIAAELSARRKAAIGVLTLIAALATYAGAVSTTPPPSATLVAVPGLLAIIVLVALASMFDRLGSSAPSSRL